MAIFPIWNPNGIPSRSPGLDREAGLPWVNDVQCINPNGVVPPRRNPVGVVGDSAIAPRVARSLQPWALGRNPFGIGKYSPRTFLERSGALGSLMPPHLAAAGQKWLNSRTFSRRESEWRATRQDALEQGRASNRCPIPGRTRLPGPPCRRLPNRQAHPRPRPRPQAGLTAIQQVGQPSLQPRPAFP